MQKTCWSCSAVFAAVAKQLQQKQAATTAEYLLYVTAIFYHEVVPRFAMTQPASEPEAFSVCCHAMDAD